MTATDAAHRVRAGSYLSIGHPPSGGRPPEPYVPPGDRDESAVDAFAAAADRPRAYAHVAGRGDACGPVPIADARWCHSARAADHA